MPVLSKVILYVLSLAGCFGLAGALFILTYSESDAAGSRFSAVSWIPWLLAAISTVIFIRSLRSNDPKGS